MLATTNSQHFDELMADELMAKWKDKKQDSLTLLKLLVLLVDNFQRNKFFFSRPLMHIPYVFDQEKLFIINFNVTTQSFEVYTKFSLSVQGYSSVRIQLGFSYILNQIVHFEKIPEQSIFLDFSLLKLC